MTSSPFNSLLQTADARIIATFGEPVEIVPRDVMPKRGPVASATRLRVTVTGVFSLKSGDMPIEGSRRGSELNGFTSLAITEATVWLSKEQAELIGYTPRKGDAVILPARDGSAVYAIAMVTPTDHDDLALYINRESPAR